jgi:peptidoglycan/xylan/chitin deacetylase (PgdA/CDA1 family)
MEFSFVNKNELAHQMACDVVLADSCNFHLSRKYRFYYRFLRPVMPIWLRQVLQKHRQVKVEDGWYVPLTYLRTLSACLQQGANDLMTIHPWPAGARFAFVLTHDVETSEGMRYIPRIAEHEERLGFRSSWNLVPYKYKIDMGLVKDLQSRGFEIGIHGYNHDGQLFSSRKLFDRRAVAINAAIRKYGAVGFRSPMVHRNLNWLQALNVEYDSSCFDIDPYQPVPGGVGTIWPFVAGRFVELPYTLPQDHTLFVSLGLRDDQIWKNKLEFIIRHQGMALMLTHPDYLTNRRESEIYFQFLNHVKNCGEYWHGLPMEITRWWREREQAIERGLPGEPSSATPNGNRAQVAFLNINTDGIEFVNR